MPDSNGQCTYCHHDESHHVWPGCNFPAERRVEFLPSVFVWVKVCGCACFDQPPHIGGDKPSVDII